MVTLALQPPTKFRRPDKQVLLQESGLLLQVLHGCCLIARGSGFGLLACQVGHKRQFHCDVVGL